MIESGYFYNPIKRDIAIVQGDTCSFGFQLQGLKGERPSSVILSCKAKVEDEDPLFMVSDNDTIDERSYDSERDILTYTVRIPPYLTQDVELGRYFYDLQVVVNNDVITLMIGRLSIEYQVTKATVSPPLIDDGDEILYPRDDIEVGAKKAYTESKINDIANGINRLLNQAYEANITGFSNELTAAQGIVSALSNQINLYNNDLVTYYLPTLSEGLSSIWDTRESILDDTAKNIRTFVNSLADYKFYNSDKLEVINAPNCTQIGSSTFKLAEKLRSVNFPAVEEIGASAFEYVGTLDDQVSFPKLKKLGNRAFYAHSGSGDLSYFFLEPTALEGNERFEFGESSLANNIGSVMSATSKLRWVEVGLHHFYGFLATKPNDSDTTITVYDNILYGTDDPITFDADDGAIVFVEDENKPYERVNGSWVDYVPEKAANFTGLEVFHSTRIRDIGFKVGNTPTSSSSYSIVYNSRVLFLIIDKDVVDLPLKYNNAGELRAVFMETSNGDLTDVLPYTSIDGSFYKCGSLKSINLPYLESAIDGCFRETGLLTLSLPALTTFGKNTNYQGCYQSTSLETVELGNGNNELNIVGYNHFSNCSKLYSLTLNYTAVPSISASNQSMSSLFSGSPIYQYLGTTTTEIVEGASAGSVDIDGTTKTTTNGNIVSYNGEDYQRVSNKWAKWGNGQNKTPRILVPDNLISSYKVHAKWGTLSPEIWRAIS